MTNETSRAVWMSDKQASALMTNAKTQRDRVLIQTGLTTGGRINELRHIKVGDFIDRQVNDNLRYFLQLAKNPDAQKTDAAQRETWVTRDLWQQVRFLVRDQDLNDDDYLFQSRTGGKLSNRAARDVVKRAAKRAYEQTKQQDMLDISSHDLRRYWANKMLNEHDINPRIVMAMGGWAAFDSMRPYMEPATPANITASMIAADNE